MSDEPDERIEQAYSNGSHAVWRRLLQECLANLGGTDLSRERLILERTEAIAALRIVCGDHGDNDWEDNLHLSDIIEKHLGRHLG